MSLQKKCFTASAILHGLLVVLVFVGSAFIPPKPKVEGPIFEIVNIPLDLVEEPNVISGNPNAGSPQPAPAVVQPRPVLPQPQPQIPVVQPEPQRKLPEPVKTPTKVETPPEPEKTVKPQNDPEPNPFDLSKAKPIKNTPTPEKPEPAFDLRQARKQTIKTTPREVQNTDNSRAAAERANQAAQLARALEGARKTVQSTGSRVGISYSDIIGPGGAAQMSYDTAVSKIYEADFKRRPIASRANESPVVVEITVRRDGTVMREQIVQKSGRAQLDRTVNDVLKSVNKVIPFPSDFSSETRTIRIEFYPDDAL